MSSNIVTKSSRKVNSYYSHALLQMGGSEGLTTSAPARVRSSTAGIGGVEDENDCE